MSTFRRSRRLPHPRLLAVAVVLGGALLTAGACGNYQLALQGTATPAAGGALGVRQLPPGSPQPVVVDPAALAAAVQAAPPGAIANQIAAPAASPAQAGAPAPAASPALASAAPARPAIGDQPGGSAAAAAPATTATPTPTPRPASTAAAPRTATPMPSFTATPPRTTSAAPRASATPSPSPSPSPTQSRPTTVQVWLPEGVSDFMYAGRTLPVDQALAALAGSYDVIYFKPAGAAESIAYRPGIDSVPTLPNNTLVRIGMKKAMSFVMQLPQ